MGGLTGGEIFCPLLDIVVETGSSIVVTSVTVLEPLEMGIEPFCGSSTITGDNGFPPLVSGGSWIIPTWITEMDPGVCEPATGNWPVIDMLPASIVWPVLGEMGPMGRSMIETEPLVSESEPLVIEIEPLVMSVSEGPITRFPFCGILITILSDTKSFAACCTLMAFSFRLMIDWD